MVREVSAMKRAAESQAEGDTGALEELRFHWGSAYDIEAGKEYTRGARTGTARS